MARVRFPVWETAFILVAIRMIKTSKAQFTHCAFTAPNSIILIWHVKSSMSKLTHRTSTVPELGAVNLSVRNGKSAIQFRACFGVPYLVGLTKPLFYMRSFRRVGRPPPWGQEQTVQGAVTELRSPQHKQRRRIDGITWL